MKTEYPYYIAAKVDAGQLVKVYKDKKFKSYNDCYDALQRWATNFPKTYSKEQFVIIEYISNYECRIITIITNTIEMKLL